MVPPTKIRRKAARFAYPKAKVLLASAASLTLGLFASHEASAASYTFSGTGNWYTAGTSPNWSPTVTNGLSNSFLNTAGNSVTINGAVNYNSGPAGGDFLVGNGDTMTIDGSGASWTQALGTNNWVKIGAGGGTVVGTSPVSMVNLTNGGAFNVASMGQQLRIGQDGGLATFTVASTGGGLVVDPSNVTSIGLGSSLVLNGGTNTFGQITAGGTLAIGGGTNTLTSLNQANIVTVTGGSTSISGTIGTTSTTVFTISGGTVIETGNGTVNFNASATFKLSGNGQFKTTGTGEFQPGATIGTGVQSISDSAVLDINGLVAFQGGATQKFDINGGALTLRATGYNGIYSNGGYFNFTVNSNGSIYFPNDANGQQNIIESQIRYNDTAYTTTTSFSTVFSVTHPNTTDTLITLIGSGPAVPEPATWMGGGAVIGLAGWGRRRSLRGTLRKLFGILS